MILANIKLFEFSAAILDSTIGERTKWGSRRSPEGVQKGSRRGSLHTTAVSGSQSLAVLGYRNDKIITFFLTKLTKIKAKLNFSLF